MERKLTTPIIIGLTLALLLTGAYALAHSSGDRGVDEAPYTYPSGMQRGFGPSWGMGGMGMMQGMMHGIGGMGPMGIMGQFNNMGGPGVFHGGGMMDDDHGWPANMGMSFGQVVTIEGKVAGTSGNFHELLIETPQGIVEVMLPGMWTTPEGNTLMWFDMLEIMKPGEEVSVKAFQTPCGEYMGLQVTTESGTYSSVMHGW